MRKIYFLLLFIVSAAYVASAGFSIDEKKIAGHRLFASDVIQPADVTVCNGATTNTIVFTSNFPGTTFSWSNNNTSIGLSANGNGNIAVFTATNATTAPVSATITVTPSDGVTNGTPVTFTITVNPTPTVNNVTNQSVCRNSTTTAVNFTGSVPGTIYNWTNTNTATGLAASGAGNISAFTATNTTNAPITSTVTVTPQFGSTPPEWLYYKFDGAGTSVPNLASNPPAGTANATINGFLTQETAGNCGGRLKGAAGNNFTNHVNTGWAPNFTGSFTISFIADGFVSNAGLSFLAGFFNSGNPANSLYIGFNAAVFSMEVQGNKFVGTSPVISGVHTITFVYDAPALVISAYLDGVLSNTTTLPQPLVISGNAFYVGAFANDFGFNPSLRAAQSMDEFRMYSRALSLAEIQALVNSCTPGVACDGTPETFNITVYPDLVVDDPADQTVCAGSATTSVNFTGTAGAVYNWTNSNPSIGLAASGTGNIPSFTPAFSGTSPVTATITVTPSFSGGPACTSSSQTFTITVNPIPDVNNVANQTVCNNAATAAINFTGTVPGTNYTWTNSDPLIGLPPNGSGNIPSFTALNTTGSPVTSTITVTPTFGSADPEILYYKFDGAGNTAPNLASNPPSGTANGTFNGTMSQGGSGTCGGALQNTGGPSSSKYFNTGWAPNLTNSSWTLSFIASGFTSASNNSFVLGCGFDYTPNYMLVTYNSSSNAGFILRGSSSNFLLSTPTAVGPSSKTVTFVYDRTAQQVRSYVDGVLANTLNISIPVDIIAPNFYIGNVAETTGPNTSSIAAGASLDEVRLYNRALSASEIQALVGSCNSGTTCTGSPEIFGITVNPSPIVNPVSSQNVCTGSNTTAINFTGNVAGATYNWTNSNPSIGLAASGTGNIASFTANNVGTTTETATITVTPIDPNSSCPGTPESFTISVSPVPTGTATPASQTVCSESAISAIAFAGNVPGITFDWTRDNLASVTGIPGVGNGNISGTLTNTTNAPVTVTFTVTPSLGGCVGTPFTVTVTVNESLPVATATLATQTICSGNITDIILSSTINGTTFNWTRDNTTSVTGIAASGTGDITGTLFNTTTTPVTVTFTIIPTFNGCDGTPITATVLVNAVPTITCPANIVTNNTTGVCGTTVNYNTTVTGAPAPTLTYTLSGATTGSGNGNGSGSLFNVGTTTVTVTATNICGTASCSFTVTVNDTENPTITCPVNIQANTDAGICAGTVATPNPVTADNCAVTKQTWTLSGATTGSSSLTGINNLGTTLFNKGITTVTYTIEDAAGNVATCSYTVTVRDLEAPVVNCPANITVTTQLGVCVAEVAYNVTATDNCPDVITQLVSGPASGSAFPIGTTTVTWRAIDDAGNISANCSFTVTVLDGQLPVVSAQPANRTICAGSNATFSVTATNVVTYQWQLWSGTAWLNINGANSSSYTVSNVNSSLNGNTFRVVLNGLCTVVNSSAATLFVNPLPTILVNTTGTSQLLPGQRTGVTANVSPTGGSFVWTLNGITINGTSGPTITPITVDGAGTYQTVYMDLNGCSITSTPLVISAQQSDRLWVYPNPNNGVFQIRYYNNFGEPVKVMVYNAAGQLVYSKQPILGEAYSRIDVNLSNQAAGIYIVKLISGNGKELAAKRIIIAK